MEAAAAASGQPPSSGVLQNTGEAMDLMHNRSFFDLHSMYTVKKLFYIPVSSRDVTDQILPGREYVLYKLFPAMESLVSDIPAGDGTIEKLFLRCMLIRIQASSKDGSKCRTT
jgi:hypothetical protein